jgi:hypothetical protein
VNEIETWEELVVAVYSKFGKNKHLKYLAALERCKQKTTVEAYYQALKHLGINFYSTTSTMMRHFLLPSSLLALEMIFKKLFFYMNRELLTLRYLSLKRRRRY